MFNGRHEIVYLTLTWSGHGPTMVFNIDSSMDKEGLIMKKVLVALCAVSVAFGAVACSKDKAPRTAASAKSDEVVAEYLTQLEGLYQVNDPDAKDPKTALTCTYILVKDGARSEATVKTAGQCDFEALKSQVSSKGTLSSSAAATIADIAINTKGLGKGGVRARMDCVGYNITTNVRSASIQDCNIRDASKAASEKEIAAAKISSLLGL